MGICQSTKSPNPSKKEAEKVITDINEVAITKQAFIFENAGRFKDFYQIG